jgi:uncharacterized protein
MKRKFSYLLTSALIACTISVSNVFSQNIPERPVPPRLVNDFARLMGSDEVSALERKLVAFNDSTSTQIAIVVVPSLMGYDKADYAQRLGEKWGVGQKGKNNGVLILIKPKTSDSNGEVQIETGYGAEGAVPDIVCAQIVDNDILPAFRQGNYYAGLDKATSTIISLVRGDFPASDYSHKVKKSVGKGVPFGLIIFILFIVISAISGRSGGSNNRHIGGGGLPFWLLMSMMGSGRNSHSGSWGGFSGGGGSSGGFGGFGGGSFGGGGAGGSW